MDNYGYGGGANGGGGGGGGFMPGETTSPSGGRQEGNNTTLRPVTIKQILDATQPYTEANYTIDGQDVSSIVFIGQVRNISTQATNVTYKLDDGTGEVEAKMWITPTEEMDTTDDLGKEGKDKNGVEVNGYAKVFGKLKSLLGGKKVINTHSVRPLTDINELHFHFLEATAVHLFHTRGPPVTGGAKDAGDSAMGGVVGAAAGGVYGGGNLPNVSPAARRVYNLLKTEPQSNEGLHAQLIAAKLGLPPSDVARAGEELINAGVIFSTVDDQTWVILDL
ncbi:putative replication factor-a protein [Aspergillus stella-maris]|uniref:putative replication factor-a protein n=1 Tax=Aspergillus stella-maris TaxID=1810926 RepID=UPI003CCC9C60